MSSSIVPLNSRSPTPRRPVHVPPRVRTTITLTLELEPNAAAALHRLCEKFGHRDALAFLYPHVSRETRSAQAYDMVGTCGVVQKALEDAGVGHWPWIEMEAQS